MQRQFQLTCSHTLRLCACRRQYNNFCIFTGDIFASNWDARLQPLGRFASTKVSPIKVQDVLKTSSSDAPVGTKDVEISLNLFQKIRAVQEPPGSAVETNVSVRQQLPNQNENNDLESSSLKGSNQEFKSLSLTPFEAEFQELLGNANSESLTIRTACQLIYDLGELRQKNGSALTSLKTVESNESFQRLYNFIQKADFVNNPSTLVHAIQGLKKLGFERRHSMIQELENELRWNLRRCPIKALAKVIQFLTKEEKLGQVSSSHLNKSTSERIGDEDGPLMTAIHMMDRRWIEAKTGSDFIATIGTFSYLSGTTIEKVEDHCAELVAQFTPIEMIKIVISLAQQKRRPTPILRAVCFHLNKSTYQISSRDLVELLYAFSTISFADSVLLHKLCLDLVSELLTLSSPSLVSALMTAVGRLRYKHKELTEVLVEWVHKNAASMRPFDIATWLLTSSVLNLKSEKQSEFFERAKATLRESDTRSPLEWLNIVHALLVVDHASPDLLVSVLKSQVVNYIDNLPKEILLPRLRLLNINAALKSTLDSSTVDIKITENQLLDPDFVIKWSSLASSQDSALSKIVQSSLSEFLPPPKYLQKEVKTNSGIFIDAVCFLNTKLEPVPIQSQSQKQVQADTTKVALVTCGYTSYCLGSLDLTGQLSLVKRQLQREGYRVVLIPFNEFNPRAPLLQRVQYLENKIKDRSSDIPSNVTR